MTRQYDNVRISCPHQEVKVNGSDDDGGSVTGWDEAECSSGVGAMAAVRENEAEGRSGGGATVGWEDEV